MELRQIKDKKTWEGFFNGIDEKTFLQSWGWGEFQLLENNKIWRFGIFSGEKLLGACLVTKIVAKRGTFLFIPHGPIIKEDKKAVFGFLVEKLRLLSKEEKASFIRFSPFWQENQENRELFNNPIFRRAPIHMHAEVTWELSINKPEEGLLASMRKTTRYLIRQAQKNPDIQIEKSTNLSDLDRFFPIYEETAKRHHFTVFSRRYLKNQLSAFMTDGQIQFFFGKYKGEIVSAAIFVFWQGGAFYHHSGSLTKYAKIPVNYLLQWEAIVEAKKRGCTMYNFWGISPDIVTEEDAKKSKHPWAGLSLFKMGFGGFRRELIKTQDIVVSRKYWLNYIIEVLRKAKRGL